MPGGYPDSLLNMTPSSEINFSERMSTLQNKQKTRKRILLTRICQIFNYSFNLKSYTVEYRNSEIQSGIYNQAREVWKGLNWGNGKLFGIRFREHVNITRALTTAAGEHLRETRDTRHSLELSLHRLFQGKTAPLIEALDRPWKFIARFHIQSPCCIRCINATGDLMERLNSWYLTNSQLNRMGKATTSLKTRIQWISQFLFLEYGYRHSTKMDWNAPITVLQSSWPMRTRPTYNLLIICVNLREEDLK